MGRHMTLLKNNLNPEETPLCVEKDHSEIVIRYSKHFKYLQKKKLELLSHIHSATAIHSYMKSGIEKKNGKSEWHACSLFCKWEIRTCPMGINDSFKWFWLFGGGVEYNL